MSDCIHGHDPQYCAKCGPLFRSDPKRYREVKEDQLRREREIRKEEKEKK